MTEPKYIYVGLHHYPDDLSTVGFAFEREADAQEWAAQELPPEFEEEYQTYERTVLIERTS